MSISYLENILKIRSPNRVVPYKGHPDTLDEKLNILNFLCQANVTAMAEIDVAHSPVVLLPRHEELEKEAWPLEVAELQVTQGTIHDKPKGTVLEMEEMQNTITHAKKTIAKAQALLEAMKQYYDGKVY